MKKTIVSVLLVITAASVCDAVEEVGRIAAVRGKVFFQRKSGSVPAAVNAKILSTDTIETRAASKVKMLFNDDSLITLSQNATMSIKKYVSGKTGKKGISILRLVEGEVRSLTGKNTFEVHTPTAVAAARGTFYTVWVEMEGGKPSTNVAVFEGAVIASSISPGVKGSVTVTKGKMTSVLKDQPPSQPTLIPRKIQDELLDCEE